MPLLASKAIRTVQISVNNIEEGIKSGRKRVPTDTDRSTHGTGDANYETRNKKPPIPLEGVRWTYFLRKHPADSMYEVSLQSLHLYAKQERVGLDFLWRLRNGSASSVFSASDFVKFQSLFITLSLFSLLFHYFFITFKDFHCFLFWNLAFLFLMASIC